MGTSGACDRHDGLSPSLCRPDLFPRVFSPVSSPTPSPIARSGSASAAEGDPTQPHGRQRRTEEWRSFIFFTVVMAPALAVIGVAGFGFLVWMYQTFIGGPPH